MFNKGDILEAENYGEPMYDDTIHLVEYVEFDENADLHTCKMLAFADKPKYTWKEEELHELREDQEPRKFKVGDKIQVRLKNRGGVNHRGRYEKDLDGLHANYGVWVKGIVNSVLDNKQYKIEHLEWNFVKGNSGISLTTVKERYLRERF